MGYARGKFGIEYQPTRVERERPHLWVVLALVVSVALVSLCVTRYRRYVQRRAEAAAVTTVVKPPSHLENTFERQVPPYRPAPVVTRAQVPAVPKMAGDVERPVALRNLLLRLDAAERAQNVEMAASTIEDIRLLPGSPAADIDDRLARRLGELNLVLLWERGRWTEEVTVRRGDSASRIAAEHGATLASLVRLNGDVTRLQVGRRLRVMDHPRISLVIRRRTRTADMMLNGKFFRRYDLAAPVDAADGAYGFSEGVRAFCSRCGIVFSVADRSELETLVPRNATAVVSEL